MFRIMQPMRPSTTVVGAALAILLLLPVESKAESSPNRKPNFVVLLCDNLGYGDIGCFGSTLHRTPNIDRMASEGMRFTSFYVTSGVCTPSRASLMTACYPRRVNMHANSRGGSVLQPVAHKGLHPDEITIAEVLMSQGYATACVGKWHLGDQPQFLPRQQGFDEYFGIPYSDDMTQRDGQPWPPLPLMKNESVVEAPADRNTLTKRYTEYAIQFMTEHKDQPFFLYLPHAMPGSTRAPFASNAFRGKSANGPYGDSVEEIDWSTGAILDAIKRLGLDDDTLVLWTSDNGAPRRNPPQGSNKPFGGWGYTTAEGGMRMPTVVRWPKKIPGGTSCGELATTMDLLPTFARLAGTKAPSDRIIDGKDIWPLLSGQPSAKTPYSVFYYYAIDQLEAVRSGPWKLTLPREANRRRPARGLGLYNVATDVGETRDLADDHPQEVKRLQALAEVARKDLGDRDQAGKNQRPAGYEPNPKPVLANK